MKFLKFVLEYDTEPNVDIWKPHHAGEQLSDFLASEFKLDRNLQSYIVTLTLSADGKVSVEAGLAAIHRHLTSMGVFGAGFAAVYPKWGGLSEVAQVGCRAGAVGGAVYMLGTGISDVVQLGTSAEAPEPPELDITLSNDIKIRTKALVRGSTSRPTGADTICLSRLTTIVSSKMSQLFEGIVDGAPTPAASVVAFPSGSLSDEEGNVSEYLTYAMVHSSDTGECPNGQCECFCLLASSQPVFSSFLCHGLFPSGSPALCHDDSI
jgi:RAB protein geranylgeranyltransferase component A